MGMDFIKRPLWTRKLSDEKLCKYLDEINEFELRGGTDSELLSYTVLTHYDNKVSVEQIKCLANDVYKEASFRWYEKNACRFR